MDKTRINDSIFDALFERAVIDNFNEELDSLPPYEEMVKIYTFSERHEQRMKRLFARERRKEQFHAFKKVSRRVAAVLLIAITLLSAALMLTPQVRAAVTQMIIEWFDEFTRFTFTGTITSPEGLEPTYIPDGFWEDFRHEDEASTIIIFANIDGKEIYFESAHAVGLFSIDNENAIYELRTIDGIDYHVLTAISEDYENSIMWEFGGRRYYLRSTITYVEYLQIIALELMQNR